MAGKKSRTSRVSKGGRQSANVAHEAKRQEKFAAKRANGTAYEYKPNPYKAGTKEWAREKALRAEKAKSSKDSISIWRSTMAKLENEIKAQHEKAKLAKENKKKKN